LAKKPVRYAELLEITYNSAHWMLLEQLRKKAAQLMEVLEKAHAQNSVHGSIARGDVTQKSDIDIFIPQPTASFTIESALEAANISINKRTVVQATPTYAMKAHIETGDNTTISFPLMKLRKTEREFYKFGGEATLEDLKKNRRVAGVDKRLMLIEPTLEGHKESTIIEREEHVAKLLGISAETVLNRVRTLLRRDDIGRTGVFIKKELLPSETFEMALNRLADQNPAVRRRMKSLT